MRNDVDWDDPEVQELAAIDRQNRIYQRQLMAHPNCQDPDHPGCEGCEPEEFEDD